MSACSSNYNNGSSAPLHVVALPLPYIGHVKPMMELCQVLADAGALVSFVNAPHHHRRLLSHHHHHHRFRFFEIPCELPDPRHNTCMADFIAPIYLMQQPFESLMSRLLLPGSATTNAAGSATTAAAAAPLPATEALPPPPPPRALLLADLRIPFAQDVADMFHVPRLALWTQSAASFACNLHFSKGHRPPQDTSTFVDCIEGLPPLKRDELGPFLTLDSCDPMFNFIMQPFSRLNEAVGVVLNTFEELELVTLANLRKDKTLTCPLLPMGPLLSITLMQHNLSLTSLHEELETHHTNKKIHKTRWIDCYNAHYEHYYPSLVTHKSYNDSKKNTIVEERIEISVNGKIHANRTSLDARSRVFDTTKTLESINAYNISHQTLTNKDVLIDYKTSHLSNNQDQDVSGRNHMMQECISWLNRQAVQSVLYISFGTVLPLPLPFLEKVCLALKATCKPFLWALRPDSIMEYDEIPDFLSSHLPLGLISPWVPQLQVLSHPSVGGFLSHCGWNSTLESLWCGVPIVTWPLFAEQKLNARCIIDTWRFGVSLERNERGFFTSTELQEKIQEVFGEKTRRDSVEKWRKEALSAQENGGTSYSNKKLLFKIIHLIIES